MNGWTPRQEVKPANKAQLEALRDLLIRHKDYNAACAVDNVIDILSHVAASEPISETAELVAVYQSQYDPRTPAQVEQDEAGEDWNRQVKKTASDTKNQTKARQTTG